MPLDDFPFTAEYAKSGRAACKGCKMNIDKDSLRLGIMIQSPHFDGKIPMWYHYSCFWRQSKAASLKNEGDIHHFDTLRWEDQEKLRTSMQGKGSAAASNGIAPVDVKISDFQVEYSKNSSAKCRECGNKILKQELRVGRKTPAKREVLWYHLACFSKKRVEFGFVFDAATIAGYNDVTEADQTLVKEKLASLKRAGESSSANGGHNGATTKAKKIKVEDAMEVDAGRMEKEALKKQIQDLYNLRDRLTSSLTKKALTHLLTHNKQGIPSGETKILDRLTDCMLFGALDPCDECKGGQLVYSSSTNAYICTGHLSGFTGCQFSTMDPKRRPFEIPDGYEDNEFLATYQFKSGTKRVFPAVTQTLPSAVAARRSSAEKTLSNLKFGFAAEVSNETKELVRELGGTFVSKIDASIIALIVPKDTTVTGEKTDSKPVQAAKKADVPVVSEEFVKGAKDSNIANLLQQHKLSSWGDKINEKIEKCKNVATTSKSIAYRSGISAPASQKLVVKGGAAVDPDCEVADHAHVYQEKNDVYNVVLGRVDVVSGINSYYKLQLLEHDKTKKYWVYRSWGRTGTTIGGNKLDDYGNSLEDAKAEFFRLYLEKTGNDWSERNDFVKKPHCFYPLDIDYGQDETKAPEGSVKPGEKSSLAKPIQDLIKMIFDIEQMKETMKEFEIDLKKMPLGKLSKKQIQDAFKVLTELQEILESAPPNQTKILDCSNRFYTLIPHDFGLKKPPLLDSNDIVKAKTDMLGNLLEIEVAYSILKGGGEVGERDPLDVHYEKLKTNIEVVDKESNEFKMIFDYVKNTHAATHNQYELVLSEVFKVSRQGEYDRFSKFKSLHNRMLLWHGSRTSNFAGILSQGLRIAPPEAPVTGYMFGKGVYFADMVSKSANYCYTNKTNSVGLLLLSEVALGNMYELRNASNITRLPANKHSVKGLGQTAPNPKQAITLDDGLVVPLGKGAPSDAGATTLLYNEYIVYDVAQVNIKYLLKVDFKYKC